MTSTPKKTNVKKPRRKKPVSKDENLSNFLSEQEANEKFSENYFEVNPVPPIIPEGEGFSVRKTVEQIAAEKRAELESQQKEVTRAPTLWELTRRFFRGK